MNQLKTGIRFGWLAASFAVALATGARAQTNVPPTVSIVSPLDGTISYTTNALIIDVQAADVDGTVTEVDLYRDGTLIASSDSSPYEFELINLSEGTNTYTASAKDNSGAVTFSAPVLIFERSEPPSYYAPYITLSSPASNAVVIAPTNLTLVAQITDLGWPVKEVNFAANNTNLGTLTDPPFSWTITNISIGSYSFTAIVTDAGGYVASSQPLPVTVIPNPATTPAVSILGPTNEATVSVGQTISLSVTVTPHGNTIDRVDFYVGNNLIGSVSSPPYSLNWQAPIVGPVCWKAVADYGQGQTASSPLTCINVVLPSGSYPHYVVVDLGPLRTNASSAFGINGLGHLVGDWPTTGGTDRSFVDIGGIITLLTNAPLVPGYASGLNDSDQLLINANQHGYIFHQGQVTDVGSLGGAATFVRSINASGQVAGDSQLANGNSHAFLYSGQTLTDLASSSSSLKSQANAINDAGAVVGWAQSAAGQFAFIYTAQQGMQQVPDPPDGSQSAGWGINNLGNVVGDSYYANTATRRGFVSIGGTTLDLGSLGDQFGNSSALSINNSNEVVGYSQEGAEQRGFLWVTNVLYDLNLLIPSNSNWSITTAYAINDAGQIVGTGRFGIVDQKEHAVLLNPLPGPGQTNLPPVVTLKTPTNNAVVPSGSDVPLAAAVVDQDGYVTNVSFYAGTQLLGSVSNPPPFAFTWTNAPAGTYQVTSAATDNLGASQTSAPITLVVQAPYPGAPRVAILSAATARDNADIKKKLVGTILFSSIDIVSVTAADPVPSLAQLLQYDALLVYDFQALDDPAALGDLLADFEDAGHGVALALYSGDTAKYPIDGRLVAQNYLPWAESGDNFGNSLTMVKVLPQHPILAGVQTFNGGQLSYYQQNVSLAPGGTIVANWSNGQTLVATRQVGNGKLVGLNFFPVSSDVYTGWWASSTDGAKLIGNALAWAASPPSETATLTTSSNVVNYLPGQNIDLTVSLTNFASPPALVDIYTNNNILVSLTNAPFTFSWQRPAIGNYLSTSVVTDAQSNTITTRALPLSVDSRLSVMLLSPTNGSVIYYPTNVLLQVAVSDLDAPIRYVDYFINGTQFIARSTNAPYSVTWNVGVVGSFPMNAVATDALGAQHSSPSNFISVIQYNPNKPVQTYWNSPEGDWLVLTNWSNGVPRPQDSAFVDNGGTAFVGSGLGTATNLTIGLSSTGAVVQTAGNLSINQSLTLGQNAGSTGYFELDGPGRLSIGQMFLGSTGSGSFVQNGGTNLITSYFDMAGNAGGKSRYDLFGGQLIAPSEYMASSQTGLFYQHGGTNTVQGLVIGASQPSVTGAYYLYDGVLSAVDEGINAQYPSVANFIQYGGTHQVSHVLSVGDQGQGLLEFAGGSLTAAQLVIGVGGSLHVNVGGGQTNGIEITGNAQLNSSLFVNLVAGYSPVPGDSWPIVSYGSYQGTFARVTLPPATNGVTWQLSYSTNQLVVTATKLPNIIVVSPVSSTTQSNLYYQIVEITNPGTAPLAGARVFVTDLPPGTQVYNAGGTVAGVPYVEYDSTIAPGQTAEFYIQLLSQTAVVHPNLILDVLAANQTLNSAGAPLVLESPLQTAAGAIVLGFNSVPNQTYYVQYSSDLMTWKTIALPIIGVGSHIEWTDAGLPRTDSSPQNQPQRFYRLLSP